MKKNTAFTLAEVLVTLMIIGVISALTIPSLKKVSDEQANVAGAQKAYSTIANATKLLKLENGSVRMWTITNEGITELYKKKMNVAGVPLSAYDVKYLSGDAYVNPNMFNPTTSFITVDGMLYCVSATSATCTGGGTANWKDGCIDWLVDVNGEKGPNVVGIDIFGFYVTAKDVFPEGGGPGISPTTCAADSSGWGCSARIIKEGKISW